MQSELLKELRPCPFCKSDHTNNWTWLDKVNGKHMLTHYCRAEGGFFRVVTVYADTPEECVERWNADVKEHSTE
jgi:hypothetical protein